MTLDGIVFERPCGPLTQYLLTYMQQRRIIEEWTTTQRQLMWFSDNRMASFDCGYDLTRRKWMEVVGESGNLVCDDFLSLLGY